MPVRRGKDSRGCYYQWGSQTRYYYTAGNKASRTRAKNKAEAQGIAIRATGWTENPKRRKRNRSRSKKKR
jgi:hypothetical protein